MSARRFHGSYVRFSFVNVAVVVSNRSCDNNLLNERHLKCKSKLLLLSCLNNWPPVRASTRTGYIVSRNLIRSDTEPKHWLDRERTKFQINFLVEEIQNACRITVKIKLSTDESRRFFSSKVSIHRFQDAEGTGIFLYKRYACDQCS